MKFIRKTTLLLRKKNYLYCLRFKRWNYDFSVEKLIELIFCVIDIEYCILHNIQVIELR